MTELNQGLQQVLTNILIRLELIEQAIAHRNKIEISTNSKGRMQFMIRQETTERVLEEYKKLKKVFKEIEWSDKDGM